MTDTPTCPRCGGSALRCTGIAQYPAGIDASQECLDCRAASNRWIPKPTTASAVANERENRSA